jgi:hypothetical protein
MKIKIATLLAVLGLLGSGVAWAASQVLSHETRLSRLEQCAADLKDDVKEMRLDIKELLSRVAK